MMRGGLILVAALGLHCGGELVLCTELVAELTECDHRPTNLSCAALSPYERIQLKARFDTFGCNGIWSDDGATVDPNACALYGWSCPEPFGPSPTSEGTRYPMVFVSGIDESPSLDWSPRILDAVVQQTGSEVHHVRLPSWSTTEVRTQALWGAISELSRGRRDTRYNLVCYAVSGLDCRNLVSPAGILFGQPTLYQELMKAIASVTTIATPHRGTAVANAALYTSDEVLQTLLGVRRGHLGGRQDLDVVDALLGLTNESVELFNERVVDAEGVYYQSWAGISYLLSDPIVEPEEGSLDNHCLGSLDIHTRDAMSELLVSTAPFAGRSISDAGLDTISPNDGMVSVQSARWGAFRGCLPADHYDVIGQFQDIGPDPNTGFDAARFYINVANDLAERGF